MDTNSEWRYCLDAILLPMFRRFLLCPHWRRSDWPPCLLPVLRLRNHISLPGFILNVQNRVQPDLCRSTSSWKTLGGNYSLSVCTNVQGCDLGFCGRGTNIIDTNGSGSFYVNEWVIARSRLKKIRHERDWSNGVWLMLRSVARSTDINPYPANVDNMVSF